MKKLFFLCCISLVCTYGCNDDSDKYFPNFSKSEEATLGSERETITVEGWEKFKLVQIKKVVNQDTIYMVDETNGTDYQGRWYHVKVDEKRMTIDYDKNETGNRGVVSLLFQGSGNSSDWFSLTQSEQFGLYIIAECMLQSDILDTWDYSYILENKRLI